MPSNPDATCLSCGTVNPLGSRACRVCGSPLEVSVFLPAGERVGNFVVKDVLGRGGFGITYRARDAGTGEIVALKELFPEGLATRAADNSVQIPSSSFKEWEQLKTLFTLEAQLLQRIKHEASTHFVALFEANDTLYLAMEFVQGETLEARLQSGKRLGMREARSLLKDVLGVLEEVHAANLLHRDIKPANIIMQPGGAELIDFGSGIYFEKNRTMKISQRILTPAYAPLELYGSNVRLSPAADLYSLAATVYEAVSGMRPPSALERANGAQLESLSVLRPDISASFAKAIDAALEVRVDARPQSVAAFRALLEVKAPKTPKAPPVVSLPKVPVPQVLVSPQGATQTVNLWSDSHMFYMAYFTLLLMTLVAFVGVVITVKSEFWVRLAYAPIAGGAIGLAVFPGSWLLVQLMRWMLVSILGFRFESMSFYRQSMLGVYSLGVPFVSFVLFGNRSEFWEFFPVLVSIGSGFSLLGLMFSKTLAKPRTPDFWLTIGFPIVVPCLLLGWFFNHSDPFDNAKNPSRPSVSSRPSTPSPPTPNKSVSSPPTSPIVSSPAQPVPNTSPSSPVAVSKAFADVAITGSKSVCQQHLGNPFLENMPDGTFLIPLDDESHAVAKALEPRLNAKALACADAANNIQKFTNVDVSPRADPAKAGAIIWQFVYNFESRLANGRRWSIMGADIVLLTAKPIEGSVQFSERVTFRGIRNFMLVSTAGLKPSDYQSAGRTTLLERVMTVIEQQRARKAVNINSLEELDALWKPQVKAALPVAVTPQELLKRLPSGDTVLKPNGGFRAAALSANGRFAVTTFPNGEVSVWDTISGKRLSRFSRFFSSGRIGYLSIDSAGRFVAAASAQTEGTDIFNTETKSWVEGQANPPVSDIDAGFVTEVQFSPDGRYLLLARRTAGNDSKLEILSVAALRQGIRTPVLSLEPDIGEIRASAFNADSSYLTVGGRNAQLRVYALQKLLGQAKRGERIQDALPLELTTKAVGDLALVRDGWMFVSNLAFSADGRWMASAYGNSRVYLWDVRANFKLVKRFRGAMAVAFSPDSQQLLFSGVSEYGSAIVLNLKRLKNDDVYLNDVGKPIFALSFNAKRQAIGISSGGFHILDTQRRLEIGK